MADKKPETPLAANIRARARQVGGLNNLRDLAGISNGAFYELLRGAEPKLPTLRKLATAGVPIPNGLLRPAA